MIKLWLGFYGLCVGLTLGYFWAWKALV